MSEVAPAGMVGGWRWPLPLQAYDRTAQLHPAERSALAEIADHHLGAWPPTSRVALARLLGPLKDVLDYAEETAPQRWVDAKRHFALRMYRTDTAYWGWDVRQWRDAITEVNRQRDSWTPALLVAYLLCDVDPGMLASTYLRYPFAVKVFGQASVDGAVQQVASVLTTWGYHEHPTVHLAVRRVLCEFLLRSRSPRLEDLTPAAIEPVFSGPTTTKLREYGGRVCRALYDLGILAPLPEGVPGAQHVQRLDDPDPAVPPEWARLCRRWYATSTLTPHVRRERYQRVLKIARWQAATHPGVPGPGAWTRELAIDCVAAIQRFRVGDWSVATTPALVRQRGKPLAASSRDGYLIDLRSFFRDCQEWDWIPRRFDPRRVLATPRSLRALIGPNPRVLADDLWAKLMWAGLHLEQADLPIGSPAGLGRRGRAWFYPLELVRAVAMVWLFAGLRNDEIRRLRVGCVRWQAADGGPVDTRSSVPNDAVCLLDVPVNKTSTAFTKPVDRLVGEAVQRWERVRPASPGLVDAKTNEVAAFLFVCRGKPLGGKFLNHSLIPLLCRKGGVPLADARGTITSHRARATIASQLYNAREGMGLFELQRWLGHRTPEATRHYVQLTPTKLAQSYRDAEYFARNVRLIEVLVDQDAVRTGAAAGGAPWKFYDLGHGYCTYDFYAQCPHRMACARCGFYAPKDWTRAQVLEGKANLMRLKQELTLTDEEIAAIEEGVQLHEHLLTRLADMQTPAGPTPRQFEQRGVALPVLPSPPQTVKARQS